MQSQEFESLREAIPATAILTIGMHLSEEHLKTFIAYIICKELAGNTLYLPLKAHHKEFTKLLLDLQMPQPKIKEVLKNEINLDNRTINKIFKEYRDE